MRNLRALGGTGRRRGAVAILVAILLIAILGILALSVDGGLLLDNRRKAQAAADAAALAAATQLFTNYPAIAASNYTTYDPNGSAAAAAQASATTNGFANDGVNAVVTVNIPPASGPFTGKAGYAEVHITYQQRRYFSAIWGSGTVPVMTRAVARGRWSGTGDGIILLDPKAKSSLNASGGGGAVVTGGAAVIVDSSNNSAAVVTGGGAITAANFQITGNYTGPLNGTVNTGVPPTLDPLRYLPAPTVPPAGTMTSTLLGSGNYQYVLTPGSYTNLPTFNAGDVVILQQASANSVGGIYYINGGGLKSTGASITMDPNTSGGVMIYNEPSSSSSSQQIQITGNASGTVNLSPLTSGPYAGIMLWQDRNSAVPMAIAGNGNFTLQGTFYAANAQLQITGNGNATIGSQYISDTLSLAGNGTITINYTDNGTARLREVILVE